MGDRVDQDYENYKVMTVDRISKNGNAVAEMPGLSGIRHVLISNGTVGKTGLVRITSGPPFPLRGEMFEFPDDAKILANIYESKPLREKIELFKPLSSDEKRDLVVELVDRNHSISSIPIPNITDKKKRRLDNIAKELKQEAIKKQNKNKENRISGASLQDTSDSKLDV